MATKTEPRWPAPSDPRFAETECVVDATHEESFALWWRWGEHYRVPWEQDNRGYMSTIGEVAKRPIAVNVWWNMIGPARVAFVEMTSQLADYEMMEQWQHAVFPCMKAFGRHANAANFGNILRNIEERHRIKLTLADEVLRVDRFLDIDHDRPRPGADPQTAYEWCERKSMEWGERALYWQALIKRIA